MSRGTYWLPLVHMYCLRALFEVFLHPTCQACDMEHRKTNVGAYRTFAVECPACGVVVSSPLSLTIDDTKRAELPARHRAFPRNCGILFTKLNDFLTGLVIYLAVQLNLHQEIATKAHNIGMQAVVSMMEEPVW